MDINQDFLIATFNLQVDSMSVQQLRNMCKTLYKTNLEQKIGYLELLRSEWNL